MLQFVQDNILMMLTIFAAFISFLGSFIGLISKNKPILFSAILLVLGFSVSVAYQISSYNQTQEAERRKDIKDQIAEAAQKARDNVINEINVNVKQTKISVDSLSKQLKETTLKEVATELVNIHSSEGANFEDTAAFAKGSPDMWFKFSRWLKTFEATSASPSLTLSVNANHHYDSGLLLAYLLTSDVTHEAIEGVIKNRSKWDNFSAEEIYLSAYNPQSQNLHWVLFFDGSTRQPRAFADAKTFTQELMVYHRLKEHEKINQLLNFRGPDAITELNRYFPSIQTAVFETDSPAELVKLMIEEQHSISVTSTDQKPYVAKLERMIQLAANSD